ncbi:LacI family DNA-binding transcriptional regulator [Pectobacterium sp. B1J-3]|uniref:LacI family DNA-binding transcriptional regulator n=1 Tax=Pectobacterium sp. B1J-3 TaxID=3385371 RepID=UPI003905F73A
MKSKQNITIKDIAKHAGVSVSTVSLVLRNSPLVADKTRLKVRQIMTDLDYVYDRSASSLRSQRSGVIALSINELSNPYFARLASSVEQAFHHRDMTIFMSDVREDTIRQTQFIEKIREHKIDGLILCPVHNTDPVQLKKQLDRAKLPCILISRNLNESGLDYVGYDHKKGIYLATKHLLECGHKRISFIGSCKTTWVGNQRLQGYKQAIDEFNGTFNQDYIIEGELTRHAGIDMIKHALALTPPPTAAVCANDLVAFGVMLGLRRMGIEPGKNFAVTGNDDIPEAALWLPDLTSVAADFDKMGEIAADMLLQRLQDPDYPQQCVNVPIHLNIRASSR